MFRSIPVPSKIFHKPDTGTVPKLFQVFQSIRPLLTMGQGGLLQGNRSGSGEGVSVGTFQAGF
jgi:hypothetical protein